LIQVSRTGKSLLPVRLSYRDDEKRLSSPFVLQAGQESGW
jgi:hypothetical protein